MTTRSASSTNTTTDADAAEHGCGPCTLCCRLLRVPELDKPAARWCGHCDPGQGCRVYAQRPDTCRGFRCLWLSDPRFPRGLRPDRCHVLVAHNVSATSAPFFPIPFP